MPSLRNVPVVLLSSSKASLEQPVMVPGGRGGGGSTKKINTGSSAPRSDPLPFYVPFLAEKIPLSYIFHWKIMKGPFKT